MEPDEAAAAMRQEAEQMMQMIRSICARKSSDFAAKDLLRWLCISLQQHSNFKMSMADIIQDIGQIYPDFQLIPLPSRTEYKQSPSPDPINVEAPPFDSAFWEGLGDV